MVVIMRVFLSLGFNPKVTVCKLFLVLAPKAIKDYVTHSELSQSGQGQTGANPQTIHKQKNLGLPHVWPGRHWNP